MGRTVDTHINELTTARESKTGKVYWHKRSWGVEAVEIQIMSSFMNIRGGISEGNLSL